MVSFIINEVFSLNLVWFWGVVNQVRRGFIKIETLTFMVMVSVTEKLV